jgi:hypothetical protein
MKRTETSTAPKDYAHLWASYLKKNESSDTAENLLVCCRAMTLKGELSDRECDALCWLLGLLDVAHGASVRQSKPVGEA